MRAAYWHGFILLLYTFRLIRYDSFTMLPCDDYTFDYIQTGLNYYEMNMGGGDGESAVTTTILI